MTVPREQQCMLPRCERAAVDPLASRRLCEEHLTEIEGGDAEPVTSIVGTPDENLPEANNQNGDTADGDGSATAEHIPRPLTELGAVFAPVQPGEKRCYRSRDLKDLYAAGDEDLEIYLHSGFNYAVVTRGDLAAFDADDPEALAAVIDALPETAWQVTGSRESECYFLEVPGLDEDIPLEDPETGENIGHVKAAAKSYVVGPGSRHPSGNRYGPLHGEEIATVDEDELRDVIEPFRPGTPEERATPELPVDLGEGAGAGSRNDDARLAVGDVLSRTGYTEGERVEHPFHGSDTGANFMVDEGGETWRCWRHDCTGNALHLIGIEQDVIDCGEWDPTGLDTDTWREIFAAARDAGYDLPEWEPDQGDFVAALPPAHRDVWDWRAAGASAVSEDAGPLTIDAARERNQEVIKDALQRSDQILVEALPTLGKSSGAIRAAAATGEPITMLTGRGRKEQYDQIRAWCDEHGLSYYTMPSFTHDCETANGAHGDDWRDRVMDWYNRGATPQDIHKNAEYELGQPAPCQAGQECPNTLKWDFEPDDYDVLIGHYAHAHKPKAVQGRTVVFDEFPAAYETRLDHGLEGAVSYFLQCHDGLPFEDYADLIEHRHDDQRRADALLWFDEDELEPESEQVFGDGAGHALAPLATFTILAGASQNLGNGWEHATWGEKGIGLFDREASAVSLLTPPPLEYTSGIVALDGTPTPEMWELAIGERLYHRQVLTDEERREYLQDALELQFVQTTEWVKPYNSADHVHVGEDAALLEAIHDTHDERPALISTSTAIGEYREAGILDEPDEPSDVDGEHVRGGAWYGNVLGSNEFAHRRVGAVIGSTHYGDRYIEKWGAYAGEAVERGEEKGADLSYGPFGDKVLTHMREHEVLQAAMRFGRDGNGATVYVHTSALPEWVPIDGTGAVDTWSDGMRQVIEAARDLDEWTTAELAAHPAVEIGERQVRTYLTELVDRDVLTRETEGCGFIWRDDGLHRLGEHGDAELEPVDVDDLTEEESAELARSNLYTWNFRTSPPDGVGEAAGSGSSVSTAATTGANGGDPPPDDAS